MKLRFAASIASLVLVWLMPCVANCQQVPSRATKPAAGTSQPMDSPNALVLELERRWRDARATMELEHNKNDYFNSITLLAKIVSARLSKAERATLVKSWSKMDWSAAPLAASGFHTDFLDALVISLAEKNERDTLADLLSRDLPGPIYRQDIEFFLAFDPTSHLKDGILVLLDAYPLATDDKIRREIAGDISRAFRASGVAGGDDRTVEACRKWYLDHRDGLEVNLKYDDIGSGPPLFGQDEYATTPLFKPKKKR